MPYKLQLPASGYISIPAWSAAVGQDFVIEAIFDTPPTIETDGVLGNLDGDNFLATLSINNGAVLTRLGGVLINGDGNSPVNQNIFEPSNKYSYRVERISNQVRTTVTNLTTSTVKQDISGVAFTDAVIFSRIGDTQGLNLGGGSFYTVELTRSGDSRYYDANASGGTGNVYPDTLNSANNGSQVGSGWSAANWIFYSSGGATYSGGAATSYAIDTVGGGLALRLGGAVTTYTIGTVGGVARTTSSGAATSYALDSTGGGTRTTTGGAVTTYAIGTVGGGDVIKGATAYPGGAAVTFAADSTGGGVVIRGGGALLSFTAETTGGATRTTTGGGAITVSLVTVGGGDVIGPGYKPTITAPAVAVRRTYPGQGVRVVKTYRAPYTVTTQKIYRGPTCRL